MMKEKYIKPLMEVVELKSEDIITASAFTKEADGKIGVALNEGDLDAYVNAGKVVLK